MTPQEQIKGQVKRILEGLLPITEAIEAEEGIYPQTYATVAAHLLVVLAAPYFISKEEMEKLA